MAALIFRRTEDEKGEKCRVVETRGERDLNRNGKMK